MPLSQNDVFPVMLPGQWWVRKATLALILVREYEVEDLAKQYPVADVWTLGEPPASRWNYADSFGPPKESLLWFRFRLDIKHPVEAYKTGTVYISTRNHQLFFVANIEGGVWILADWEVTVLKKLLKPDRFKQLPDLGLCQPAP